MTKKLVIEISDDEGRTQLLKRRNGVVKFLDNIDSMFKRGSIVRAIDGVKMFFTSEEGGTVPFTGDLTESVTIDLSEDVRADTRGEETTFVPGKTSINIDLSDALPLEVKDEPVVGNPED